MDFDSLPDDSASQAAPVPQTTAQPGAPNFDSLVDDSQKFSTPEQKLKAGLEGAARGIVGPAAPYLESKFGVNKQDILAREKANPGVAAASEIGGLVGGTVLAPEVGIPGLMGKVGEAVKAATGIGESTFLAKVGSEAVKQAAEMSVLQGSDEFAKKVIQDPDATASNAIAHIGLAGALGAGGGAFTAGILSPLWKATVGPQIEGWGKALLSRVGGSEGADAVDKAADLESKLGVQIPKEIKGVINDAPMARESHSMLSQDDASIAGRGYQKTLNTLDNQVGTKVAEALGKTPEDLQNIPEKNLYESGRNAADTLHGELSKVIDPINQAYEDTTNKFKGSAVSPDVIKSMGEQLSSAAIKNGWDKAFDDQNINLVNKIVDKLPQQSTINDLKNAISNLYRPYDAPDFKAALEAKKILSKGLEEAISSHMGPEAVTEYTNLRSKYASLSNYLEDLDTHLHVGKWSGPGSFLNALKERGATKGEQLFSNMTTKNNGNLLELLQYTPETLNLVKNHYTDTALRAATNLDGEIKTGKLVSELNKLSPQQQALIATPEQHQVINAANELTEALKDPTHNFSNTARALAKQMHGALSPLSIVAMLMGHGEAGFLSLMGSIGFREAKPALRLTMLKMLSSKAPVNAAALKTTAAYINAAQKSETRITKAVANMFKGSGNTLTDLTSNAADIKHLEKLVASEDPNEIPNRLNSSPLGHYMGEHQTAITATATGAIQYLQQLKPKEQPVGVLDGHMPVLPQQQARYTSALKIAQDPLLLTQKIKDGTIQTNDLVDLKNMYPKLYVTLTQKITNQIAERKADDETIPYKTRMGLSMFMGQPLDASMQPSSIQAAQPPPQPQPQQPQATMKGKKGKSAIDKLSNSYKTPGQTAESDRSARD